MATAVLMWVCWNHVTGGGRAIQHVAEISEFFQGTGYAGFPLRRHAECQDRRDGGRADGDARPSRRVLGGRGLADEGDGHGCCDPVGGSASTRITASRPTTARRPSRIWSPDARSSLFRSEERR